MGATECQQSERATSNFAASKWLIEPTCCLDYEGWNNQRLGRRLDRQRDNKAVLAASPRSPIRESRPKTSGAQLYRNNPRHTKDAAYIT
jgi:hypothetical protein